MGVMTLLPHHPHLQNESLRFNVIHMNCFFECVQYEPSNRNSEQNTAFWGGIIQCASNT